MQYQQTLSAFGIGVVVNVTPRLQLQLLEHAAESLTKAIASVKFGEVIHIKIDV